MKKTFLAIAALAFISTGELYAQTKLIEKVVKKGDELVIPYEKYQLKNGLTLIIHEDHSDPVVHVDVTYHVGSAREEIGKSGFAHFFEHMMFQGSDNVADEQHFKVVTEAGGTLNGTTNTDRTNYFQTVPANELEKMLWLEADRMGFLLDAVTQEKFEIQRATVKNERGQNYDNRPYGLAMEVISQNLYPYGHPYSWLTIGYVEDLDRVNVNDLKNFFLRWYGPNNATLTIGGDVKPAEVIKLVEKYFGSIPRGPEVKNMPPAVPSLDKHRFVSYVDNYAQVPLMAQVFPTVPDYHPDRAPLAALAQILGQGNNSVLYQQLTKKQLALQAMASSSLQELSGVFMLQVVPYPGQELSKMFYLLKNALDSFEKRGVTQDDIDKFIGGYESSFISGLQSVSGKVSQLAAFETYTGNPNQIGKLLKQYQSVTKEDVMRVYNKYIKHKHPVTLSVLTKQQNAATAAVTTNNYTIDKSGYTAPDYGYNGLKYVKAKDQFNRSIIPASGPNPSVKVPDFWRKDWDNGIRFIGAENTEIPTVNISIRMPGGHLLSSGDLSKAGVPSFFAALMNEDTKNYKAEELSLALQKLGSAISISSSFDNISFNVQSQVKNLDATLKLLEEKMLRPNFQQDDLTRNIRQAMEGFKMEKSDPAAIAENVNNKILYGKDNVFSIPADGTETTVPKITLADIQHYYDNYMTSQGVDVVIVGDISEAEVMPKLEFLKKLPNKKITLPAVPAAQQVDKARLYIVDVKNAAQSQLKVGYVTDLKYDPTGDYYKAVIMNYPLGGAFNSRINLNLREDKGWTYGASSFVYGTKYAAEFGFDAGVKFDATDSSLTEALKELSEYAQNGITSEELQFTKSAIGQRDALKYETGGQKAGFIGNILYYNLSKDYVEKQAALLQNITKEELDAMARRMIDLKKMNIVVVGDKDKILPGLEKLGYEIIELDTDGNVKEKKTF